MNRGLKARHLRIARTFFSRLFYPLCQRGFFAFVEGRHFSHRRPNDFGFERVAADAVGFKNRAAARNQTSVTRCGFRIFALGRLRRKFCLRSGNKLFVLSRASFDERLVWPERILANHMSARNH